MTALAKQLPQTSQHIISILLLCCLLLLLCCLQLWQDIFKQQPPQSAALA